MAAAHISRTTLAAAVAVAVLLSLSTATTAKKIFVQGHLDLTIEGSETFRDDAVRVAMSTMVWCCAPTWRVVLGAWSTAR